MQKLSIRTGGNERLENNVVTVTNNFYMVVPIEIQILAIHSVLAALSKLLRSDNNSRVRRNEVTLVRIYRCTKRLSDTRVLQEYMLHVVLV